MKNRHIYHILFGPVMLLMVAIACVEPVQYPQFGDQEVYPITFCVRTQDDDLITKADLLSGEDKIVSSLFMYCFDVNGRYLGRYEATELSPEEMAYSATQTPGTFKGEIPPATARIHFVANADCPVGGDMIGKTEEQVMHTPGLVYRSVGDDMSYWGYLSRNSPTELAGEFSNDSKIIVWLIRDRVRIEAGTHNPDPENPIYFDDIKWVVYNGLNHGFIASYGTDEEGRWNDINPYKEIIVPLKGTDQQPIVDNDSRKYIYDLNHIYTKVTPYTEEHQDRTDRFITDITQMVPFTSANPMFVFDDECPVYNTDHVVKLIVAVRYVADGQNAQYKYFPICITDGYSEEPVPLKRGHRYQLNLQVLPEAYGYADFDGAAAATTFANGALVEIPDDVVEVSDGKYDIRVNYQLTYPMSQETFNSSAILIQNYGEMGVTHTANEFSVKVPFSVHEDIVQSDDERKTFYFTESKWVPNVSSNPAHDGNKDVTWGLGISKGTDDSIYSTNALGSLESTITLPLKDPVSSTLKESVYNLKGYYLAPIGGQPDIHHILMRNISVYTITKFQIQSGAYTTSSSGGDGHNAAGNLELLPVQGQNGNYTLKFKLPKDDSYPALLYPLQIKIASRTLQPTSIQVTNGESFSNAVFGIQVFSTEYNVPPAKLTTTSAETDIKQWNYQATTNPWNFWYSYAMMSVPKYTVAVTETVGEETITHNVGDVIEGPEIVIGLKDIRYLEGAFSNANRPSNVGLYLYIEFFGEAVGVFYNNPPTPS